MRVAIVGSRDYPDLEAVRRYVWSLPKNTVVISGAARGVDQAAMEAAWNRGLDVVGFAPDWSQGRHAGPDRNTKIVANADRVVAFWWRGSRGTADTIRKARAAGKPVTVIEP